MGTATVLVDGVVVATVNLSSATSGGPQVVWSRSWDTAGRHQVTVRVDQAKVEVDGFYALR